MTSAHRVHAIGWLLVLLAGTDAAAEPMFLGRQYTRCTTCHHSAAGGGLLTPYGRSLTHRELSTFVDRQSREGDEGQETPRGEGAFLWGALGNALGPVRLGLALRPSHVRFASSGISGDRTFWMTADLLAAVRLQNWTLYGQVGREPTPSGGTLKSYEYWAAYQSEGGLGVRAGRFLPAYGIRFADHTSFNRQYLGLAQYDQLYGVEVSRTGTRSLLQVTVGPGVADALLDDDRDGSFTGAARLQYDLGARTVVVGSGLYRHESGLEPRSGVGGVAFGWSPGARSTIWTQFDVEAREGLGALRYLLVNETAVEAFRGVWLKLSPQLRTGGGPLSPDLARLAVGAVLLPRKHWNVNVTYYRDRNRTLAISSNTWLVQLHAYP
jgi:hypothetical protein